MDILGIIRAASKDLLEWRKTQGASTLTQQLSKMLFLTPDKSFRRKFQEMLLAIQIERYFTKSQIFTMYANQVDLGHGNFGFEAAAQFYFGKHLNELTLPEAATAGGDSALAHGLLPDRASRTGAAAAQPGAARHATKREKSIPPSFTRPRPLPSD